MGPRFPSLTGGAEPVTITIYRVSPSPRGAHLPHATPSSARLPGPAQNEQRAQFGSWTHSIVWLGKAGDSSLEDGGVLGLGDAGRIADRRVDDVEDRAPGPDVAHLEHQQQRRLKPPDPTAGLAGAAHLVIVEPGAGALAGHPRAVVHRGRQPIPTVREALVPWPVPCTKRRVRQLPSSASRMRGGSGPVVRPPSTMMRWLTEGSPSAVVPEAPVASQTALTKPLKGRRAKVKARVMPLASAPRLPMMRKLSGSLAWKLELKKIPAAQRNRLSERRKVEL